MSTEIRFGYTLADLHRFALSACRTAWTAAGDQSDRFEAAWHGVAVALYEAEHWVPDYKLISGGQRAVLDMVNESMRHHGIHRGERRGVFETYWADWAHTRTGSHEGRIVESVALWQVFEHLPPREREALLALAAHGDYERAAEAAGMSYSLLSVTLSNARRRFLALWHDGETPAQRREHYFSRPPKDPANLKPCGTYPAYHRHRMHKEVPCEPCRQAYREYRLELKRRKAAA